MLSWFLPLWIDRAAKITKAMAEMPSREAKYYQVGLKLDCELSLWVISDRILLLVWEQEAAERRPVKGLVYQLKRLEGMWKKKLQHYEVPGKDSSAGKKGAKGGKGAAKGGKKGKK